MYMLARDELEVVLFAMVLAAIYVTSRSTANFTF